jgi:hypothetical protein
MGVTLFFALLFLMESFIKEFILVINNEVVRAVGKGDHRSVWQTPAEAPGYCNGET